MIKEFWELLLRTVPAPLRFTLIVVVGILSIQVVVTKVMTGMDYRDAFLDKFFLTAASIVGITVAFQVLRFASRPWSYVGCGLLGAASVGVAIIGWNQWQYVYDRGVYEQRHWKAAGHDNDRYSLTWEIRAALDKPSEITVGVFIRPKNCPGVTIQDFHPVIVKSSAAAVDIQGSEVGDQNESHREFKFTEFERPATMRFRLTLASVNPTVNPETCFSPVLGVSGGSSSDADGQGEEKKE